MVLCPVTKLRFGNALRRASGLAHGGGVCEAEPERARSPTGAAANRRAGPPGGKPARSLTRRCVHPPAMSTLTEIEAAVETLPPGQKKELLVFLAKQLGHKVQPRTRKPRGSKTAERPSASSSGAGKRWPVPPPKVSKAETQRIARLIGEEFGRVDWESWK